MSMTSGSVSGIVRRAGGGVRLPTIAVIVWAFLLAVPTLAQKPPGGWVTAEGHSPFVSVVQKVKDAVVNISAEKVVDIRRLHSFEPFFEDWFGPNEERSKQKSLGSGFVIRQDGYILTNYHVVTGADNITVRLSDRAEEIAAKVVGTDRETDLAVLKIDPPHPLATIPFGDSDSMLVGDWVIAIGNPFPQQGLDRTVTVGVVSALGRKSLNFGRETPTYQDYIQTDASINPGNSGGPLVNLEGEAVGVNAAIASPTGANVGIGFAIPINFAKLVIPDLMSKGTVSRGWLGVSLRDLTWDDVEAEGLKSSEGVLVDQIIPGSPAEQAHLKVGDVLLTINGEKMSDAQQFMRTIWQKQVGASVELGLVRNGREHTIAVTLEDRNKAMREVSANADEPSRSQDKQNLWLGIEVSTATTELADQYGTEYHAGVIVTGIDAAGPAYEKGIQVGMIISEVDHTPIRNRADYEAVAARVGSQSRAVSLLVYDQRGQTRYVAIRPEHEN